MLRSSSCSRRMTMQSREGLTVTGWAVLAEVQVADSAALELELVVPRRRLGATAAAFSASQMHTSTPIPRLETSSCGRFTRCSRDWRRLLRAQRFPCSWLETSTRFPVPHHTACLRQVAFTRRIPTLPLIRWASCSRRQSLFTTCHLRRLTQASARCLSTTRTVRLRLRLDIRRRTSALTPRRTTRSARTTSPRMRSQSS
mmetsp:Transcript_1185/g.2859  ORF Transcript_1185/g.2859 Transcript_1185/m.2859 type:complete len:200 (+) Transcript_1185:1319-1918(+)